MHDRWDANAARFFINYMRGILAMAGCIMCERPEAVIGIIVIVAIFDWFDQFNARTRLNRQSTRYQLLSAGVTLSVWIVVFLSKAVVAVGRALAIAIAFALLHATLRCHPEEQRDAIKSNAQRRRKRRC